MYLRATRLLASTVIPVLVMLGVFAYPLLKAWQRSTDIATHSGPVLMFAAAAFCFQFVGALQNMFLSATGRAGRDGEVESGPGGRLAVAVHAPGTALRSGGGGGGFVDCELGSDWALYRLRELAGRGRFFRAGVESLRPAPAAIAGVLRAGAAVAVPSERIQECSRRVPGLGAVYVSVAVLLKVIPREDVRLVWGMVTRRGRHAVTVCDRKTERLEVHGGRGSGGCLLAPGWHAWR